MDVHEALRTRRTIHRYTRDAVPEAVVQRALEAASHAPNHRHTWPWRFTVVGRPARSVLADLAVRLKTPEGGDLPEASVARVRAKILDPAWLVVVSRVHHDDPVVAREDYAAVSCAIQNILLSVWADGFGSKWSTGAVTRHPETYAHLGIDETGEEIVGFVWIGVPRDAHPPPRRPDLPTLVRRTEPPEDATAP